MNNENELMLYEMFYDYLKENGYSNDQDPDEYWEDLEETLSFIFQQVINEYGEEDET